MIKILFCTSEVAPFAKTGGLADVTGSLPAALGKLGIQLRVLLPRYRGLQAAPHRLSDNVSVHFIEHEGYFNRHALYGDPKGDYEDNLERFSFFCHAALDWARREGFRPDVVHAHDWQTALLPVLLKTKFREDPFFNKTKSLLTIHNLAYQGQFPAKQFAVTGLDPSLFGIEGFEFYGKINLLKAGLLFADAISTVSPTYARDIQTREYGFGLDGVVTRRASRLRGILNGIDTAAWDPSSDKALGANFSATAAEGKRACKADLQRRLGLPESAHTPLFAVVSRLAEQKGMDMLCEAADSLLARKIQFVLLGEGDAVYQTAFRNIGKRHPSNASVTIGFDAAQARRVYAGADFFLMPSLFEPCGLGQMISFRYGTLPVARRTGGLADTIIDLDADGRRGNGFLFDDRSGQKMLQAMDRAIALYGDTARMEEARRRAMEADFSWDKSALEYKNYYGSLINA